VEHCTQSDRAAALASAVAHDINEELTVILNSLSASRLGSVEQAARRCAGITDRLLAYSRRRGEVVRTAPLSTVLLHWD
jgi:hypothetical protein